MNSLHFPIYYIKIVSIYSIFFFLPFFAQTQADNCAGATVITLGNCSNYTNNEDNETPGFSSCGSGNDRSDVWYRYTGDGNPVNISCTSDRNARLAIYTTCPGTMTSDIHCATVANDGTPTVIPLNTTNGVTYYIRIHRTGGNATADHAGRLCVVDPPDVAEPGGPICDEASAFCSSSYLFPNSTSEVAQTGPDYACLSDQLNPVWYYMEISNPGTLQLLIEQEDAVSGLDVDFAMWGPFTNITSACTAIEGVIPSTCTYRIYLYDDWDDGWQGGQIDVLVNGSVVLDNISIGSGQSGSFMTFSAPNGATIQVQSVVSGTYPDEISFDVADTYGNYIIEYWYPYYNGSASELANCYSLGVAPIQSSYSSASTETIGIGLPGGSNNICDHGIGASTPAAATAGQIYVVMITNYSDDPGFITFSQTGGTATTNCNIVVLGNAVNLTGEFVQMGNLLRWNLFGNEADISHYHLMRSNDGQTWDFVEQVELTDYDENKKYRVIDQKYKRRSNNYYKVITVKLDGSAEETEVIVINNGDGEQAEVIKMMNILGQEVDEKYAGLIIYVYSDGTIVKKYNKPH